MQKTREFRAGEGEEGKMNPAESQTSAIITPKLVFDKLLKNHGLYFNITKQDINIDMFKYQRPIVQAYGLAGSLRFWPEQNEKSSMLEVFAGNTCLGIRTLTNYGDSSIRLTYEDNAGGKADSLKRFKGDPVADALLKAYHDKIMFIHTLSGVDVNELKLSDLERFIMSQFIKES